MSFTPLRAAWSRQSSTASALKQREERWMEIIRNGEATLSQINEADFGTANPNGLDIDHWKGDPLIEFDITKEQKRFLGSVEWSQPDRVRLHGLFDSVKNLPTFPLRGQAVSMFSHETIHSRQGFEHQIGLYAASGNFLNGLKASPENQEKIDRIIQKTKFYSIGKYHLSDYLAVNVEMQARLHEALCIAYQEWKVLPTNREEFFAALHGVGFNLPEETFKTLQSSKTGLEALERFKLTDYTKIQAWLPVALLNNVFEIADLSHMEPSHWEYEMSYIYGHLLSLYGDKEGFSRMFVNEPPREILLNTLRDINSNPYNLNIDEIVASIPDAHIIPFLWGLRNQEQPDDMVVQFEDKFDENRRLPDVYSKLERP